MAIVVAVAVAIAAVVVVFVVVIVCACAVGGVVVAAAGVVFDDVGVCCRRLCRFKCCVPLVPLMVL